MSPDDPRRDVIIADRIDHMIEAIDQIVAFAEDHDKASFMGDLKTVMACRAAFIVIGEAVGGIPEDFRESNTAVPWAEARHYRNFLIHVYDQIDPSKLWETIRESLPPMREQLADLRKRLP